MTFTSAINIVREIANVQYYIKYMAIGVKIPIGVKMHIVEFDHYNAIKEKLIL